MIKISFSGKIAPVPGYFATVHFYLIVLLIKAKYKLMLDQTWESQNIGDTNKFMLSFKESIVRIFTQQWRKDIESSSKLRTYALVKKYFCVEPYILHIRGNHLITAMARYRMSSHDPNIERGRFNNPITPKNQRICTRCELN